MSVMTKDDVTEFEDEHLTVHDGTMWMELPLVSAAGLDEGDGSAAVVKLEDDEDMGQLVGMKQEDEPGGDAAQIVSMVGSGGSLIRANHATLQALLSTPISAGQVFATTGGTQDAGGLQVLTLSHTPEVVGINATASGAASSGATVGGLATVSALGGEQRLVQMIPTATDLSGVATKYIGLFAVPAPGLIVQDGKDVSGLSGLEMVQATETGELMAAATAENMAALLMPPPPVPDRTAAGLAGGIADRLVGDLSSLTTKFGSLIGHHELPPNCPAWATQLKNCEKIGDSYRGYVSNEVELDLILTLHKQQTNSFWGTRQSPSPAKSSTRLMWKSQYVPFDGIPFVNAGSRAVVMECQFGPRRKGTLGKRSAPPTVSTEFKQTCPARIYIKKVRKFADYAVKLDQDKKSIRMAMDKAFHELREQGIDTWGEERFYVQLPTEKAHDYHDENSPQPRADPLHPQLSMQQTVISGPHMVSATSSTPTNNVSPAAPVVVHPDNSGGVGTVSGQTAQRAEARIHPAVLDRLRQLVAGGETKLYAIRKQLRRFVVRELFQGTGQVPERHDLTMFPTVNDLKNHIHQALKDIENGLLPVTYSETEQQDPSVKTESPEMSEDPKSSPSSLWSGSSAGGSSSSSSGGPMPETVTVTLTQNPGEDGHHIISRIETHLSDGTTHVSTTLTPETAQLLSRLHPGLFPAGSLMQSDGASHFNSPNPHSQKSQTEEQGTTGINEVSSSSGSLTTSTHKTSEPGCSTGQADQIEDLNLGNIGASDSPHVIVSEELDNSSQQLVGLVGIDPDSTSSMSNIIPSSVVDEDGREEDVESVRQQCRPSTVKVKNKKQKKRPATQGSRISTLSSRDGQSSKPSEMEILMSDGQCNGAHSKVSVDIIPKQGSCMNVTNTSTTTASSISAIPLLQPSAVQSINQPQFNIFNGLDPATINQIVQSGARLSIIPGHPNTLALVPAEPSLVSGQDSATELNVAESHSHLTLDTEHLMIGRSTSGLEEDYDKLSHDKISLHITADQEIGMAKLENQVSSL